MLGVEDADQAAARVARDGGVRIREASLHDREGRPRQVFESGEPIRLVMTAAARPSWKWQWAWKQRILKFCRN